jgi:hypothetical protein
MGDFTALDNKGQISAWSIATGKVSKPIVNVASFEFKGFSVYYCNENDNTYRRNWQ